MRLDRSQARRPQRQRPLRLVCSAAGPIHSEGASRAGVQTVPANGSADGTTRGVAEPETKGGGFISIASVPHLTHRESY